MEWLGGIRSPVRWAGDARGHKVTLYWIDEDDEERRGQMADHGGPHFVDFWSPVRSTARLRWRRPDDIPPPPSETRSYSVSPFYLFNIRRRSLWHITPVANLPSIVKHGGILSDAHQIGAGLDPYRVLGWGDIYAGAPSRDFVAFAISYRAAMKEIASVPPGDLALALLRVDNAAVLRGDNTGVRFFPGWPDEMDLTEGGLPGMAGNRGAAWLFTPAGDPQPGASVFVPEWVDLSSIREVHLIDPPAGVIETVGGWDWQPGCEMKSVALADWVSS